MPNQVTQALTAALEAALGVPAATELIYMLEGNWPSSTLQLTNLDVGEAKNGAFALEYGDGIVHRTHLKLTDLAVETNRGGAGTPASGGLHVYDFPMGAVLFLGGAVRGSYTGSFRCNASFRSLCSLGYESVGEGLSLDSGAGVSSFTLVADHYASPEKVATLGAGSGGISNAGKIAVYPSLNANTQVHVNFSLPDGEFVWDVTDKPTLLTSLDLYLYWINLCPAISAIAAPAPPPPGP